VDSTMPRALPTLTPALRGGLARRGAQALREEGGGLEGTGGDRGCTVGDAMGAAAEIPGPLVRERLATEGTRMGPLRSRSGTTPSPTMASR
jgi:hypothetical protein